MADFVSDTCRSGGFSEVKVRRLIGSGFADGIDWDGMQLCMRVHRREHIAMLRDPAPIPAGPTKRWSMNFVNDTLTDGRLVRVLTVVDNWSRHSRLPEAGYRMSRRHALDQVLGKGLGPLSISVNPGPEFHP